MAYMECMYLSQVKLNDFNPDRKLQSTFHAPFVEGTIHNSSPNHNSDYFMVLLRKMTETQGTDFSTKSSCKQFSEVLVWKPTRL